ncbi:MAG: hypothetical protein V4557_17275 [Bacteroidota bacterium]
MKRNMTLIQRISFIGLSFLLVFSIVRLLTAQKKIAANQKPVYKPVVIRSVNPRGYSPTAYIVGADVSTFHRKC